MVAVKRNNIVNRFMILNSTVVDNKNCATIEQFEK